jgi:hypothetical protein
MSAETIGKEMGLDLGDWTLDAHALPRHVLAMLDDLVDTFDARQGTNFDRESVLEALIVKAWTDDGGRVDELYLASGKALIV